MAWNRKHNEIVRLTDLTEQLERELKDYRPHRQYLPLAIEIGRTVMELAEKGLIAPGVDIMGLAMETVKAREIERERAKLIEEVTRRQRQTLIEQVQRELEEQEGTAIAADVMQKLKSDAETMEQARRSARDDIRARYRVQIGEKLAAEQESLIASEAERQIALEVYDAQFRLNGMLDTKNEQLLAILQPGDTLTLHVADPDHKDSEYGKVRFMWEKNLKDDSHGWVLDGYTKSKSFEMQDVVPSKRFCDVGCVIPDYSNGGEDFMTILKRDTAPAVRITTAQVNQDAVSEEISLRTLESITEYNTRYGRYDTQDDIDLGKLVGIDFNIRAFEAIPVELDS